MAFLIAHKTEESLYIFGFSNKNMCVQRTRAVCSSKTFKTEESASKFIKKYSNAGFGFESKDWKIIDLQQAL